jgi:hypothetical protein
MSGESGPFQLHRLVEDEEIEQRIFLQVCALQPEVYLTREKDGELRQLTIDLMKKLDKVRYHSARCRELAHNAIAAAKANPPSKSDVEVVHIDHTSGIEAEVEAFLFQTKATLDVLCKILSPLAGISLATFGSKGDKVIKALRGNVPKDRQDRAAELIRLIENDQGWLTHLIDLRDTAAHFRGLPSSGVQAHHVGDALVVMEPASQTGEPFSSLVGTAYFNLLTFCEDFVALAINLAMPKGLTVIITAPSDRTDLTKNRFVVAALKMPSRDQSGS